MNYLIPKEIMAAFADSGVYKTNMPVLKFIIIAILGGAFIAFGGLLTVMVAGGMPDLYISSPGLVKFVAGALFPVGLIMVSITGADLFTSDCTAFTLPLLERRIKLKIYIRFFILSYLFNFLGAQIVAYLLSASIDMYANDPWQHYLHQLADAKVNQSFWKVFLKGIGANWLVCLGMWMGFASKDIIGKCIGIWIPVMMFVTLGYEHSIANMFFIPSAIYSGANILWSDFLIQNLIPATLGNIVGGAGLVGCVYWFLFKE